MTKSINGISCLLRRSRWEYLKSAASPQSFKAKVASFPPGPVKCFSEVSDSHWELPLGISNSTDLGAEVWCLGCDLLVASSCFLMFGQLYCCGVVSRFLTQFGSALPK